MTWLHSAPPPLSPHAPAGEHGTIVLPSGKTVGVTRIHMEEDSAKMNHQGAGTSLAGSTHSLVDFNRSAFRLHFNRAAFLGQSGRRVMCFCMHDTAAKSDASR